MQDPIFSYLQQFRSHLISCLTKEAAEWTQQERQALGPLLSSFLRKWVYSALFQDSALAPINLIQYPTPGLEMRLSLHGSYGEDGFSLMLTPVADTLQSHHFLRDLWALGEVFYPDGSYDPSGWFPLLAPSSLRDTLFTDDPFYYRYLCEIAIGLGLLKKLPGIHAAKWQFSPQAPFWSLSPLQQLQSITEEAFRLAVRHIAAMLQAPSLPLDTEDIRQFCTQEFQTDALFRQAYHHLGYDYDHLNDMAQREDLSPEDEALVSTAYTMGVAFDAWIFTPLGHYLSLIRPLYVTPFSMEEELDWIRPTLLTGCTMEHEFFSPPHDIFLTSLGEAVLGPGTNKTPLRQNYLPLPPEDVDALLAARAMTYAPTPKAQPTFVLSVCFSDDPQCWKWVEAPCDGTLEAFYQAPLSYFGLEPGPHQFYLASHTSPAHLHPLANQWAYHMDAFNWEDYDLAIRLTVLNNEMLRVSLKERRVYQKHGPLPRLLRQSHPFPRFPLDLH